MKILAVDYGESRTGLAICDATEMLTRAITPQIEEKSMNKVVEAVVEAAKANGAEKIVVGLCKNMDGTEGSQAKKCRRIAGKIAELWGSEPVMWDEHCSGYFAGGSDRCRQRFGVYGRFYQAKVYSPDASVC